MAKAKIEIDGTDEALEKLRAIADAANEVAEAVDVATSAIKRLFDAMAGLGDIDSEVSITGEDEVGQMIDAALKGEKNG